MEPESSLPCSKKPATGLYIKSTKALYKCYVLTRWEVNPSPNLQDGGPFHIDYPRLLTPCIHSYPPYLEAVSSIRNLGLARWTLGFATTVCKMDLREIGWGWEVDGTGWGSCPVGGFGISGVEPWGSATRELVQQKEMTEETSLSTSSWSHLFKMSLLSVPVQKIEFPLNTPDG